MSNDEQNYFLNRARAERRLAEQASSEPARKAHSILSGLYLDRAYGDEGSGDAAAE